MSTSAVDQDHPVGIVAGRGLLPLEFCRAARRAGVNRIAAVAIHQDTFLEIEERADSVEWFFAGQLNAAIRSLKKRGVRQCVLAGQIRPRRLFGGLRPDWRAFRALRQLKRRNADTIFSAVVAELARDGIEVLPSTTFLEEALARPGVLGRVQPSKPLRKDLDLGWRIAQEVARLDIGQTVVVKRGTVLAVEGFEGTDKAIRRGGELANGGVTVVKTAKPGHDMRFDVPCVGMRTVRSLETAGARALGVHAGKSLLLERGPLLAECDRLGIAVVGLAPEG